MKPYVRPLHDITNGITTAVRNMRPPRYTVGEAAMLVGRSRNTLINWRKNGTYVPSDSMQFGAITVWLYTDRDIANMRKLTETLKPGRPRKDVGTAHRKSA